MGKDACLSSQGPSQPSLSPVQLSTGPEAGLNKINSIKTPANPGERFISGRRGGRKSAGPTRTTGSTRQEDSSTLPCRQGLTLLTIPSLDCSSVWLLILMLLLFLLYLSLPYGIFHSTTTRYLLASYISLPHATTRNILAWSTPSRCSLQFSTQAYFLHIWGCEGCILSPAWVIGHGEVPKEEEL